MRLAVLLALVMVLPGCAVEATDDQPAAPVAGQNQLTGTVLETLDVANYTYVRFETADGEAWAAVPQARLEVGSRVVIDGPQAMSNFESKTLGRTFETIYFGTLGGPQSSAKGEADPHGLQAGMRGMVNEGDANTGPIEVAKAEGESGRTIAELYAEKSDLAGKTVALRGTVVKYNAGIMGLNWIHLQDGTGDATDGTHDITVTSSGTTSVGDTILIQGTVAVDKDFGAGYRYDVIVEDASVK